MILKITPFYLQNKKRAKYKVCSLDTFLKSYLIKPQKVLFEIAKRLKTAWLQFFISSLAFIVVESLISILPYVEETDSNHTLYVF